MRKNGKKAAPELDVAGLLALKIYERPEAKRTEKNIQNIMRAVRSTNRTPSLLLFPDKSFAWMFAQPRYGVAALFVLFLGLHLLDRPMPVTTVGPVANTMIRDPGAEMIAEANTNQLKAAKIPGIAPTFPVTGEPEPLSAYLK